MGKKEISVTHTLDEAWNLMLANWLKIMLLLAIFLGSAFVIVLGFQLWSQLLSETAVKIGKALLNQIFYTVSDIAIATVSLKLADQQRIQPHDLISRQKLFFHLLAANILYTLIILVGLILFIIPGIIFALRFSLYDLYIVDEGCGPIQALKKSWKTVEGYTWKWLGFVVLTLLVLLLGLLLFGVGLLVAWPTVVIARALLFRKLSTGNSHEA